MQFVIIGNDGDDEGALERRMAARDAHVKNIDDNMDNMLIGAAMLDDIDGDMCGSVMIVDFPSEKELHEWLENEPYVKGNVWDDVTIIPCKLGPSFAK